MLQHESSLMLPSLDWMLQLHLRLPSNAPALAAIVVTIVATLWLISKRNEHPMPPGPLRFPIVGSLFSWPSSNSWFTFAKWRALYGDIIYANVMGTKIIILNSPDVAKALLDGQGSVYSDRPTMYLANILVGWKDSPGLCRESHPYFKPARQLMNQAVGSRNALESWIGMEEHEVHRFLRRIVEQPEKLRYYGRKLAGSIILRIVYGYDVKSGDDEYVDLIERVNADLLAAVTPGKFAVDFIPALQYVPRWMPGTGWMKTMDRMRAGLEEVLTKPIDFVESQLNSHTARPSLVSSVLQTPNPNRRCLAWTAEVLYTGGADTSLSAMLTFFLCMTLFPEVQKKAQQELDEVIGSDTLPKWSDRSRLPYVSALVKELLRWGPIAPQAMPHCGNRDGTFNGYFIPKEAMIIANIWGFTHDPTTYPDPEAFTPERFLDPFPQANPMDLVFGFGRRVCPGRQLAESTLFLVAACSLSMLSISKKIGPDGQPITPVVEYTGHTTVYPTEFECDIRPRSREAEAFVMSVEDAPYPG